MKKQTNKQGNNRSKKDRPATYRKKSQQGDRKPSQDDRKPRQGDRKPRQDERKPSQDDRKSRQGDRKPSQDDRKPRQGDRKPRQDERKPSQDDRKSRQGDRKPAGKKKSVDSGEVRLNKYIANAGICSRREADELIGAGLVSVNGKVVSEMGVKVKPGDDVRYNGVRLDNERKVYLLLNKPKDFVTTVDDPHAKKTVMDLVGKACKERIYPVGRLDRNTTGVLLFTNDGELTKRLTHPSFNKKKIYHVFLDKNLAHQDLNQIAEGVELEDGMAYVDAIAYASKENKKEIGLEIHSGRNRVVRRIFQKLGYDVTKLDRVYFAGLTKKDLPRGRYRFLTDKEIKTLKMNAFE